MLGQCLNMLISHMKSMYTINLHSTLIIFERKSKAEKEVAAEIHKGYGCSS